MMSKNLLPYNFNKIEDKNKMKNYSQGKRKFYNKYLEKMKLNMIRSIIFKRKIIMIIFLKKIIKKDYNNQYIEILKIIKMKKLMILHKNNYNYYKHK